MSRSKKIFGLIARDLPGVVLCKDMLVVVPTQHIVRGFLLETTTEKDKIYLWRAITPLHRPMQHPFLDYSERIPNGQKVFINRSAYQESADTIRSIITEHIPFLRRILQPQDFLRHIEPKIRNRSILFRIDLALTYYLVGKRSQSIEIFRELDVEVDRLDEMQQQYVLPLVKRVVHEIDTNPRGLTPLLDEWETQNVEILELQPARVLPSK